MKDHKSNFRQFAKGGKEVSTNKSGANCVIYTRVSTKEQADNNQSLETQKKACKHYADKEGLPVLAFYGGTYESAQTDERKEFKKMLDFVKKSKEKVSFIIVYSLDRFSRSGANAIYITSELKKQGISVLSVTQPADTNTASGSLQQNIQFIFSQYDNDLRRQKCMAGTKERLLKGEWATVAPVGYDNITKNGIKSIVINEKGLLLRKAFLWKANEGITNEEILKRLAAQGLKINRQHISKIFRNPFYCGMIAHNLLQGEVIEGKHEKLVSKEIFLKVNQELMKNPQGYKVDEKNNQIPLKRFLKCANCGRFLRGYIVKRKKIHYYKCSNGACSCNKNAKQIHQKFEKILAYLTIDKKDIPEFRSKLIETFEEMNKDLEENSVQLKSQLNEVNKKLERLEERFIYEEINKELFEKFNQKLKAEKREIENQLEKSPFKKSNLSQFIDQSLKIVSNLHDMWVLGDYNSRQGLQYLVFPEGIYYNKKNDECRTERLNYIFDLIRNISEDYNKKERGQLNELIQLSPLVVRRGIEPLLPE